MVVGGGESSRLYQKLVKEKEVAASVFAGVNGRAGPSKFQITAMVRPGKTPEEVEGLISEEIARLVAQPVSEKELQNARTTIRRGAVARARAHSTSPSRWPTTRLCYNDPNRINTESEKRLAVTAADIQKAAQAYLKAANRVCGHNRAGRSAQTGRQAELRSQRHDQTILSSIVAAIVPAAVAAGAGAAGPTAVRGRRCQAQSRAGFE